LWRVMAKQVQMQFKLQVVGGQATPAPPVGPALGQNGVNIPQFIQQFNDRTKDKMGMVVPVVVTVYTDRSFSFVTKSPPAAVLLRQAAGIAKGSGTPNTETVGTVTREQVEEIGRTKMEDLNATDLDGACRIIEGTARSMGIKMAEADEVSGPADGTVEAEKEAG